MEPFLKRTWAQVDLDALDHNIREIRSAIAPSAKLMCVIKADGYGHGAVPLAKESEAAGADWFAVSNLEEAQELREAGIQKPILILALPRTATPGFWPRWRFPRRCFPRATRGSCRLTPRRPEHG